MSTPTTTPGCPFCKRDDPAPHACDPRDRFFSEYRALQTRPPKYTMMPDSVRRTIKRFR